MSNSIANAAPIAPAAASAAPAAAASATSSKKSAQAQPKPVAQAPQDTVKLSTAAQSAAQEATETQAQTIKEAGTGDRQAVKLLAKERAAQKAAE